MQGGEGERGWPAGGGGEGGGPEFEVEEGGGRGAAGQARRGHLQHTNATINDFFLILIVF
jgi:hypothetical protein